MGAKSLYNDPAATEGLEIPQLNATANAIVSVLDDIPCGSIICAAESPHYVLHLNAIVANWAVCDLEYAVGRPLADVLGDAFNPFKTVLARARHEPNARVDGVGATWPDGRRRTATLTCSPLPVNSATRPAVVCMIVESSPILSTKPASMEEIQTHIDRARETLAALPIPIWLFDTRGRVRYVNRETLQLFDVSDFESFVELVGATIPEQTALLRPRLTTPAKIATVTREGIKSMGASSGDGEDSNDQPWISQQRRQQAEEMTPAELPMSHALKRRTVPNMIISMVHPTQEVEIIVRASASPIKNGLGQIVGAFYVTIPVTEEMLSNGQRDAFLAMAGHDLRNPLTPVKFLLQQVRQMLTRKGGNDREIEYLNKVLTQVERINDISLELDSVAAHDRSALAMAKPTCDLVALCQEVAEHQMKAHPETPVIVRATPTQIMGAWSPRHLERAITMLVHSAVRRSPTGKPVMIRVKSLNNRVRVEIADQGDALTPEGLASLRQILSRGGAALAMAQGGDLDISAVQTLLGLYRSRLQITTRTRQTQGTTYMFELTQPMTIVES